MRAKRKNSFLLVKEGIGSGSGLIAEGSGVHDRGTAAVSLKVVCLCSRD